jgi:hypothetical protein
LPLPLARQVWPGYKCKILNDIDKVTGKHASPFSQTKPPQI